MAAFVLPIYVNILKTLERLYLKILGSFWATHAFSQNPADMPVFKYQLT